MNIFNIKKKYLVLFLFFIVGLIYFQTSKSKKEEGFVIKTTSLILGEIQTVSVIFQSEIADIIKKYLFLTGLRDKNRDLKIENAKLKTQYQFFKEIQLENKRLKKSLQFSKTNSLSLLPARVIAKDSISPNHSIVINRGSFHGVKKYMGVIHPKGVVGYIFRTTPHSSQVITLFSQFSSLPARNQRNRINGLIDLHKTKGLIFKYFPLNEKKDSFKIGDAIVTARSNEFPAGFPIGYIESLETKKWKLTPTPIIRPYISYSSLEELFVLTNLNKENYEN